LSGETGIIIVGIMAIILLFSVLTGLIRWLQKRRDKLHRHM
jgi:uncharacterized iron-regulated membrane protein